MIIPRVNVKSLLVASLLAAYGAYLVDRYFAGAFGLFGLYPPNDAWWLLHHHAESLLFALPFAWPVLYERLPGAGWLKGVTYGFLWWLLVPFLVGTVFSRLGAGTFPQFYAPAASIISAVLLNLVWGFLLGVLYAPPADEIE
jgi:hypothetical protein